MDLFKEGILIYSFGVALDIATTETAIRFFHAEEENQFVRFLLSYGALGIVMWILFNIIPILLLIAVEFEFKKLAKIRKEFVRYPKNLNYIVLTIAVLRLFPGFLNFALIISKI